MMGFHAFRASDADTPAPELLLNVLTQGDSSRLQQLLVQDTQTAVQVGSYLQQGFDPGAAYVFAVLPPGGDTAKVEAQIDVELKRIAAEGITPAELEKARSAKLAGFWRSQATISGKAQALGTYEVFHGDFAKLFAVPQAFDAIDNETLKRVAAQVFRADNRTVGVLLPAAKE
jgi:zinc protease